MDTVTNDQVISRFEFDEYVDFALHGKGQGHYLNQPDNRRASRKTDDPSWSGTATWDRATKLLETGWEQGRDYIDKILTDIEASTLHVPKRKVIHDVTGSFVDIGAALAGTPECMMRWERRRTKQRVVRIAANICASAGVSTEAMKWRGACTLALVDKLEASKVRCEVDVINGLNSGRWIIIYNVKKASEKLYLDRLSFHIAHPSAFRRIMFSAMENLEAGKGNGVMPDGSYGCPDKEVANSLARAGEVYDFVVPSLHLTEVDKAVAWVEETFGQIFHGEKYYQP